MRKADIGFLQELQPNGMIAKSANRKGFFILLGGAMILLFASWYMTNIQIKDMSKLMTQTIKETTITPKDGILVQITTEKPILSPLEFRDNIKSLPGIPTYIILLLVAAATGSKAWQKFQEEKGLNATTPVLIQSETPKSFDLLIKTRSDYFNLFGKICPDGKTLEEILDAIKTNTQFL